MNFFKKIFTNKEESQTINSKQELKIEEKTVELQKDNDNTAVHWNNNWKKER